ncbi:RagB/SusD family nutrient uptake outer membrane protein [Niabella aurantiaca]|uniref:RagB/SusD family nutrient uptake outer membrane protein n=1 Tax=Niabella aurantiaca TaxID=379900 RepID=UPI00037F6538|nr:RagB/SusD family nutrient uptake outer membrane protein [Niabella aurantiaca]
MKKIRLQLSGTVLLFVLLASCNKFLDKNPDMRAEINSIDKVAQLLVSAYPERHYITFAEVASDNVEDKSAVLADYNTEPFPTLYNWKEMIEDINGSPVKYWNAAYEAIAAANQALASIEEYQFGASARQYRGEALVARAYAHFMLVTFFAKAYEPGGANASPGVPYVDEPETVAIKKYDRGTVASVYARIEKDLTEGLPLLTGGQWQVPKYHFNPQAAHAFAARFYLFKGDWDKVIEQVSAILPANNFKENLRPYTGALYNLTYTEHRVEYTKAEKPWNLLLANTYSNFQRGSSSVGAAGNARYSFGETKKDIYNKVTVFGAAFRNRYGVYTAPNYTTNKYNEYFYYTNVAAGIGYPYIMMPLFTVDEALLNRAEAFIQKEQFDAAITDLNTFASTRIVNYDPAKHTLTTDKAKTFFNEADDKAALIKAVLETRQIAFMQEGIRWMDILRHKLPVTHNHIATDGTETFETLGADDNRRMFQIPQDAKLSGVMPNPR